jgi:hypothetical protein
MKTLAVLIAAGWSLLLASADAANVSLTVIAETGMARPEGGTFGELQTAAEPQIHGSEIYFMDNGHLYRYRQGGTEMIVSNGAVYPELDYGPIYVGRWGFNPIGEEHVILQAGSTGGMVIAEYDHGTVRWRADPRTPIAGTTNLLPRLLNYAASRDKTLVQSDSYDPASNVWYSISNGAAHVFLTNGAPIQGTDAKLGFAASIYIGPSNYVLYAKLSTGAEGLLLKDDTGIRPIILSDAFVPELGRSFLAFSSVAFDENGLAFVGVDPTLSGYICRYYQGQLAPLLPAGSGIVAGGPIGFDGGNTACFATVGTNSGIHVFAGDIPVEVAIPSRDSVPLVRMERKCLSGNTVVVVVLDGQTNRIVKAELTFEDAIPVPGDYDGDGEEDPAFYDEASDAWFVRTRTRTFESYRFGYGPTLPAPGDFDGDGTVDRAVYDPPYGNWYIAQSTDGFTVRQFGYEQARPIPADFDGDARADVAVYDPATGWWYIMTWDGAFRAQQFGYAGTQPIAADFDNDHAADLCAYETATGNWYILPSTDPFSVRQFGYPGVTPLRADFDGNGADYAVFDPDNGRWYAIGQVAGFTAREFGYHGVREVNADYDGDARSDLAVYDQGTAIWYILRSSQGFTMGGL